MRMRKRLVVILGRGNVSGGLYRRVECMSVMCMNGELIGEAMVFKPTLYNINLLVSLR